MLLQSGKDLATDNAPHWAAAVAYYTLLPLFPLLPAAASIAAFFVSPQWAVGQVRQQSASGGMKNGNENTLRD